jgi:hypothetical protein
MQAAPTTEARKRVGEFGQGAGDPNPGPPLRAAEPARHFCVGQLGIDAKAHRLGAVRRQFRQRSIEACPNRCQIRQLLDPPKLFVIELHPFEAKSPPGTILDALVADRIGEQVASDAKNPGDRRHPRVAITAAGAKGRREGLRGQVGSLSTQAVRRWKYASTVAACRS